MLTLTVLALALVAPAKLEFSHPIDRAEVVLEALGKQVGVRIRPSGVLGDDRIYVRLHDTDWETAKQKLAEGLRAEWRQSGGTLYLYRPKAEETDKRKAAIESLKQWQKAIKVDSDYSFQTLVRKLTQMEADKQRDPDYNRSSDFGFETNVSLWNLNAGMKNVGLLAPGVRTLLRLIPLLDPEEVVRRMGKPGTIASTDPMPRDMRLPASTVPVLKEYWADRAAAIRAIEATGDTENIIWFDSLIGRKTPPPEDQVPMVVIDFEESQLALSLVCIVDSRLVEMGRIWIDLDRKIASDEEEEPVDFLDITVPLVLTREQRIVTKLNARMFIWEDDDDSFNEQDKARARELMKDPVVNDPLQLVCEPVLEQAAEAMGVSMVALMNDWSSWHGHWVNVENVTVGAALTQMANHIWSARRTDADGFVLLTPRYLSELEWLPLDRVGARDLSADIERTNDMSLEAFLRAYKRIGDDSQFSATVSHVFMAHGIEELSVPFDRFQPWAWLSPTQAKAARSTGYKIKVKDLPRAVQTLVFENISSAHHTMSETALNESELNVLYGGGYDINDLAFMGYGEAEEPPSVQSLLALRNGIPPGVIADVRIYRSLNIRIKPKEEEATQFGTRFAYRVGLAFMTDIQYEMGIARYAELMYWISQLDEEEKGEIPFDMKNLSLGYWETLLFLVEVPGIGYTYVQSGLPTGVLEPQYKPYEDLPRAVRDEIAVLVKKWEEIYKGG